MKKLLINNQKTANYLNFLMFFYILLFIVLPLQLSVLVPNSIFGTFFSDYKLLGLFTFLPVLLFFYTGVFYNLIKIDSYIINLSCSRNKFFSSNIKSLLDIKHDMLLDFSFKKNFLSWNTELLVSFKSDKSKTITKKIYLTFISSHDKNRIESRLNSILKK